MIGKRDQFWGGSKKQSALELRWCLAADCSRGGFLPPEMHDCQQWTAAYVGSLAVRMTTTGNGGGWNRRRAHGSPQDFFQGGGANWQWGSLKGGSPPAWSRAAARWESGGEAPEADDILSKWCINTWSTEVLDNICAKKTFQHSGGEVSHPPCPCLGASMDVLDIVRKILWNQTMQPSVNEHSQLEIDVFWKLQPVQSLPCRRPMSSCEKILFPSHMGP